MLPGEMMQADAHDMGRVFGIDFAVRLSTAPLDRWNGRYRSTCGLHLFHVSARTSAACVGHHSAGARSSSGVSGFAPTRCGPLGFAVEDAAYVVGKVATFWVSEQTQADWN